MIASEVRGSLADALLLSRALLRHRALAVLRDIKSPQLYFVATLAGVTLFCLILAGTFIATATLQAAQAYGLLASIPAWAFLVYLFTDILIAFGQALGDLYLSRDMPILLVMPVRVPSIIAAKFVLGVVQNEVYVAVFLLPFVIGFLLASHVAWWAYVMAIVGVAAFPATLYAALVVLTIAALRIIPAKAAKETLLLVGAAVPTLFWVLSFYRVAHIGGDLASLRLPDPPKWLPSTWLGNVLSSLAAGQPLHALAWMAVLLGVTLVACPLAMAAVASGFAHGWSGAWATPSRRIRNAARALRPRLPVLWTCARKDAWIFLRTPQLWFNHIAALGFVGYLLVGHKTQTPLLPMTVQLAMVQIGFVSILAALNPGMIAISLERRCAWLMKSSPLLPKEILGAKLCVAYAQSAGIAVVGAVALGAGYHFGGLDVTALALFALLMCACGICCGILFDSAFPSFEWENPNMINRGVRMVIPFLSSLGVLALCAVALWICRLALHGAPQGAAAVCCGLAGAAAIVAIVVSASLRRASSNIEALEV
ncbi:MAG: hypothetical protein GIW99_05275 [Candidatus Eremiobacteraeota bacterium]|nr:hypothetical protein [Candidatus Eremiobacteraeota bacterium]MBC5827078.1 hypothetical protein [Candidatus Eremiobacteraeota bacterium]